MSDKHGVSLDHFPIFEENGVPGENLENSVQPDWTFSLDEC